MSNIKVSVIMPMYNAKKLVSYSINSLLAQTLKEIEIIVVDDKSTDDTYAYCKELYRDEPRVRIVLAEKNGGPGEARTLGISLAVGEYITFLDSDDGIMPEALECMYAEAKKYNADVVHTTGILIPVAKSMPDDLMSLPENRLCPTTQDKNATTETVVLSSDIGKRMDGWLMHMYQGNVWGKLFRREFLVDNEIVFPKMKMMEDIIYSLKALLTAKTYVQMPGNFIIYRITNESTSRGKRNTAFVAKLLRVMLQTNIEIPKCFNSVDYFEDHPEYITKTMKVLTAVGETMYVGPAYQKLGRETVEQDPIVRAVWEDFFGLQADYVSDLWYRNMDRLPPVADNLDMYDTYEYWEKKLEEHLAKESE